MNNWNEGHDIEALYTLHILMGMIDDHLIECPSVLKYGLQGDIIKAQDILMEVYQRIGRERL